jgi:hypothetical protein
VNRLPDGDRFPIPRHPGHGLDRGDSVDGIGPLPSSERDDRRVKRKCPRWRVDAEVTIGGGADGDHLLIEDLRHRRFNARQPDHQPAR